MAAPARRGRVRRRHVARGVRRRGARPAPAGRRQPGDRPRRRSGHLRRDRRRHARPDADRARHRGAEAAPPRPDADGGGGVVPALLRARGRLRPRRPADARAPARRRLVAALGPEGVDDERPARQLRPAARAHERRRAQAQGPDDVHRPDGRRGRHDPPAAPGLRRRALQRGVLRRRRAPGRLRGRPGRRRLGRRADDADVRARRDRARRRGLRLARRPVRERAARRRGVHARRRDAPPASARSRRSSSPCASRATAC